MYSIATESGDVGRGAEGGLALLAFVGEGDPFGAGVVDGQQPVGPILSTLACLSCVSLGLIVERGQEKRGEEMVRVVKERLVGVDVWVEVIESLAAMSFVGVMAELRGVLDRWEGRLGVGIERWICLRAGPDVVQAGWLYLQMRGELDLRLADVLAPEIGGESRPLLREVDIGRSQVGGGWVTGVCREDAGGGLYEGGVRLSGAMAEVGLVTADLGMLRALRMVEVLAAHEAPVLVLGETGTGKELVARLLHKLSGRSARLFVPVNCGAMPAELAESILFGHSKGAFTGAHAGSKGKFEVADGGTLFLDEIGELSEPVQVKLLRVLQDGVVEPIGARRGRRVDVRVVACTNRDLDTAVKQGTFREDLYYRLSFSAVRLPPLRERRGDIPLLAAHILARINRSLAEPRVLSQGALKRLQGQAWRGNVRDLENVLGRSVLMSRGKVLEAEDLLLSVAVRKRDLFGGLPDPCEGFSMDEYVRGVRTQLILRAMELAGGKQSGAARLLGISPQAVHKFLRAGVEPEGQ